MWSDFFSNLTGAKRWSSVASFPLFGTIIGTCACATTELIRYETLMEFKLD